MVKDCSRVQSCISKPSSFLPPSRKTKIGESISPEKRSFNQRWASRIISVFQCFCGEIMISLFTLLSPPVLAFMVVSSEESPFLSCFRSEIGQRSFRKQEEAKLLFSCRSGLEGRAVGVKANRINQSVLGNRLTRRADSGPQSKLLLVDRGQRKGSFCFKSRNDHARDTRLQATSYSVHGQRWE